MTLRVGIVGPGAIGKDHARRIRASGGVARVVAAASRSPESVRAAFPADLCELEVFASGADMISSGHVDAVVVASPGAAHEEAVVAAVRRDVPVLCEKPLADDAAACLRIIGAEVARGRRLVQVGFMRRFDPAYRALKRELETSPPGSPLVYYSAHRNPATPAGWEPETPLVDAAPHDFDVARWLLDTEITTVTAVSDRSNPRVPGLRDPILMTLTTDKGVLVHVETSLNMGGHYGYDIRGHLLCSSGALELTEQALGPARTADTRTHFASWRERFEQAFDVQLLEWIESVTRGVEPPGATAWDGYVAQAASDAAVASLGGGTKTRVDLADRPDLYS